MNKTEFEIVSSKDSAMVAFGHLPRVAKDAIQRGVKMIFTGDPCKKGHYAPRYAINMTCVFCQKSLVKEKRVQQKLEREQQNAKELSVHKKMIEKALIESRAWLRDRVVSADGPALGQAIAAYLLNEGAVSVIPGVIRNAETIVKDAPWLLEAIRRAIHHKVAQRDRQSGVLFFQCILVANRPSDESQARYWREAFNDLPDTVLTNGIRCMVTTSLIDLFETNRRAKSRSILLAWLGDNESSIKDNMLEVA